VGFSAALGSTFVIPSATPTTIPYTNVEFNSGMYNGVSTATIPITGIYTISVNFSANGALAGMVYIMVNGTIVRSQYLATPTAHTAGSLSFQYFLTVGDTVNAGAVVTGGSVTLPTSITIGTTTVPNPNSFSMALV
jgi:hypothetical protein